MTTARGTSSPTTGSVGLVSLVGAGPGDADLLTVRGARRLADADLVLYDALVAPAVIALATRAQRFSVGKRAGRRSIDQATIHRLMIRAARRGKRVVRLKSGDPFVLGRGGEEALALREAGVPFEVVPGITSAVAAPDLAGVPLTHRGISSGFLVTSGHAEEAFAPLLDALAPNSLTVVVLMGLASRSRIADRLLATGWRPDTPVALVRSAGGENMAVWQGRLDQLGREDSTVLERPGRAPGTIIIGDVVALRKSIVARAPEEAKAMASPSTG